MTTSSVQILWGSPSSNGGCSLTGYSILRDDGASGSFVTVHSSSTLNNPSLNSFTVTDLPTSPTGLTVRFKIAAYNKGGYSVLSNSISVIIASVPITPLTAPYSDPTITNDYAIKIIYGVPSNGGSPIINYEIQMSNSIGGGFVTVAGGSTQIFLYSYFTAT